MGITPSGHLGLYHDGVTSDFGFPPGSAFVSPAALNNADQIVGTANPSSDKPPLYAFLYSGGMFHNLGAFTAGGDSAGNAINNLGQVVGRATTNGFEHPFLYSNGALTDLGTLRGTDAEALGINDSGQVVGYSDAGINIIHAFLYSQGTLRDLGTGGFTMSTATAVNASGDVVGWLANSSLAQNSHAFMYHNGLMTDLGAGLANAINSSGEVVGYARGPGYAQGHAFLWVNGVGTDLNTLIDPSSGWTLLSANGINDAGQIIGYGSHAGQNGFALLLTPLPEPGGLVVICLPAMLLYRRRKSAGLV